jgi:RNA polymerase sigma-70 factor (ECF subfamily)
MTAHPDDVDDVVQELFVRAWKGLPRFRGDAQFSTWLYRIAVNTAIKHRGRRRDENAVSLSAEELTGGLESLASDPTSAEGGDPFLSAQRREQEALVRRAVMALPEKQRAVVVLHYFEGHSCEEIGEIVGCSVGTVWSRLHYACKRLKGDARGAGRERGMTRMKSMGTVPKHRSWACRRVEPLLAAYGEDALSPRQAARVRGHLEACAACSEELQTLRALGALLRGRKPPVPEPAADLWRRIRAEIGPADGKAAVPPYGRPDGGSARSRWRPSIALPLAGLASISAVAAAAVGIYLRGAATPPSVAVTASGSGPLAAPARIRTVPRMVEGTGSDARPAATSDVASAELPAPDPFAPLGERMASAPSARTRTSRPRAARRSAVAPPAAAVAAAASPSGKTGRRQGPSIVAMTRGGKPAPFVDPSLLNAVGRTWTGGREVADARAAGGGNGTGAGMGTSAAAAPAAAALGESGGFAAARPSYPAGGDLSAGAEVTAGGFADARDAGTVAAADAMGRRHGRRRARRDLARDEGGGPRRDPAHLPAAVWWLRGVAGGGRGNRVAGDARRQRVRLGQGVDGQAPARPVPIRAAAAEVIRGMRDRINVSHRWCAAAAASRAAVVLLGGAVVTPAAFPVAAQARAVPKPETAAVASSEKVPPGAAAAAATLQKNGDRRLRKGELAEAAREFVRAALTAPGDPVYRLTAGVALATVGDVRAAASQFRHAQRLADDDVVAALLLQGALSEQGLAGPAQTVGLDTIRRFTLEGKAGLDASGSIARLKAAVARFPDSAVVHLLLGDAYQISDNGRTPSGCTTARPRSPPNGPSRTSTAAFCGWRRGGRARRSPASRPPSAVTPATGRCGCGRATPSSRWAAPGKPSVPTGASRTSPGWPPRPRPASARSTWKGSSSTPP